MLTTKNLIEWIKTRVDPALGAVDEDYGSECIQKLREWDEVRAGLLKIVEGIEEIEAIYLEKE